MSARSWLLRSALAGALLATSAACILGPKQDDPAPTSSNPGDRSPADGGGFTADGTTGSDTSPATPADTGIGAPPEAGIGDAAADTGKHADAGPDAADGDAPDDGDDADRGDAAATDAPADDVLGDAPLAD